MSDIAAEARAEVSKILEGDEVTAIDDSALFEDKIAELEAKLAEVTSDSREWQSALWKSEVRLNKAEAVIEDVERDLETCPPLSQVKDVRKRIADYRAEVSKILEGIK
jgi:septal ring factor EnvC (AmiA/AmiB activator)